MALTRSLQYEGKDIVEAVTDLKCVVQDLRDKYHDEWFAVVEQMCTAIGAEPSLPRLCARQTQRSISNPKGILSANHHHSTT